MKLLPQRLQAVLQVLMCTVYYLLERQTGIPACKEAILIYSYTM